MKRKTLHSQILFVAITTTLVLYTNCDANFKPIDGGIFRGSSSNISCMNDPDTATCLLFKNTFVASLLSDPSQNSPTSPGELDLSSLQTIAVESSEIGNIERLESPDVTVESLRSGPAFARNGMWKFLFSEDNGAALGRVSAYHHISKALSYASDVLGAPSALSGSGLLVLTDADRTGYSVDDHAIYLQDDDNGHSLSLDAGLTLHFLGEAYLAKATSGAIYDLTGDTRHRACGKLEGPVYEADCCVDKNGCSSAISAGQADYWVAMGFSNYPAVGESFARSINGLQHCGLSRNPELNASLTADSAFKACEADGNAGQVYSMSLVYSSIWFEARKALSRLGQDPIQIDRVFLAHLPKLKGSDNFSRALVAIRAAATEVGSASLIPLFEDQFAKRGID